MVKVIDLGMFSMGSLRSSTLWLLFAGGKLWVKLSLWSTLFFIASCSLEKELPIVCVTEDKRTTAELCREYRRRDLEEVEKKDVLHKYGFNKRDAQAIYALTSEGSSSCKAAVVKQCDLIMLRNGVGY